MKEKRGSAPPDLAGAALPARNATSRSACAGLRIPSPTAPSSSNLRIVFMPASSRLIASRANACVCTRSVARRRTVLSPVLEAGEVGRPDTITTSEQRLTASAVPIRVECCIGDVLRIEHERVERRAAAIERTCRNPLPQRTTVGARYVLPRHQVRESTPVYG